MWYEGALSSVNMNTEMTERSSEQANVIIQKTPSLYLSVVTHPISNRGFCGRPL